MMVNVDDVREISKLVDECRKISGELDRLYNGLLFLLEKNAYSYNIKNRQKEIQEKIKEYEQIVFCITNCDFS